MLAEGGEHREVLEAYRMFANDHGWSHKLHEAVATGLTAEAAVERVQSDTRARMLRSTDPYLRERLHDLDDLANRLLRTLVGKGNGVARENLPENAILVARSMGPAALLGYDRALLRQTKVSTLHAGQLPDLIVFTQAVLDTFDLRPAAIIRDLDLIRPIYSQVTNYGHFGRELDVMTWERTDRAEALARAVKG